MKRTLRTGWLLPLAFIGLAATAQIGRAQEGPLDASVSFRVRDVSLEAYLDIISRQTGINFVVSDRCQPQKITAYFINVSARDALDLLQNKGLTYYEINGRKRFIVEPR